MSWHFAPEPVRIVAEGPNKSLQSADITADDGYELTAPLFANARTAVEFIERNGDPMKVYVIIPATTAF